MSSKDIKRVLVPTVWAHFNDVSLGHKVTDAWLSVYRSIVPVSIRYSLYADSTTYPQSNGKTWTWLDTPQDLVDILVGREDQPITDPHTSKHDYAHIKHLGESWWIDQKPGMPYDTFMEFWLLREEIVYELKENFHDLTRQEWLDGDKV